MISVDKKPAIFFSSLMQTALERKATDLHLCPGSRPRARIDGVLMDLDDRVLSLEDCEFVLRSIFNEVQWQTLREEGTVELTHDYSPDCRLHINAHWLPTGPALALRVHRTGILDFERLHLPSVLRDLCHRPRGIVLVTGMGGSGKTVTLATMLAHINKTRNCHIVTIEERIEFVHRNVNCLLTQREVGYSPQASVRALRAALREHPDVLFVGEIKEAETVRLALAAADAGCLVFGSLQTPRALPTLARLLAFFGSTERGILRQLLSENLQALICQRLLPRLGGGLVPALEIVIGTPKVKRLIAQDEFADLEGTIQSRESGMQTFNQALLDLMKGEKVLESAAMKVSPDPADLQQLILAERRGTAGTTGSA